MTLKYAKIIKIKGVSRMANKRDDAMLRKKSCFHWLIGYQLLNKFVLTGFHYIAFCNIQHSSVEQQN